MAYRIEESSKEPGRLSSYLRVFGEVSNPKEIDKVESDSFVPIKDAELLKRRRAKKSDEECGAGAPNRHFGDGIKLNLSLIDDPLPSDDPRFEFLLDPGGEDDFHLRNELNFDLATVTKFKESQDPRLKSYSQVVGHDLQWLERKLEVKLLLGLKKRFLTFFHGSLHS